MNYKHVHFIGIGGLGMSALARMLLAKGITVTGSDPSESIVTKALIEKGAKISYTVTSDNVEEGTDLIVYTLAITKEDPEFVEAQRRRIKTLSYPQFLGEVTSFYKTIAISGTHGKTTTTAMTAQSLEAAGLSPRMVVGSLLKYKRKNGSEEFTNYADGSGEYFVIESCEYRRSFLNVNPFVLVITNLEEDHLDYYKDLADIQDAFGELAAKIPAKGFLICNPSDSNLAPVIKRAVCKVVDYTEFLPDFELKVPGGHNKLDAACARAVASIVGAFGEEVDGALKSFTGTWRRFEYKGELTNGAILYDDFAHHPSEIRATLSGAKERFPNKKILIAFHPHLFSRTKQLFNGFVEELSKADSLVLAPIYPAREPFDPSISSSMLAEAINAHGGQAVAKKTFEEIAEYITEHSDNTTVVITMGAGDIYKISDILNLKS